MLTNGNVLLTAAHEGNYAVPAFNISDYAMFNGIIEISEAENAPLIVAIHPDEVAHFGIDAVAAIRARAHRSSVPVAIHWDHGGSYEEMLTAVQGGFTSVMIDRSMDSFEENVRISKRVVETAHAVGVSVEAELGTIGAADSYGEAGAKEIIYTTPDEAVEFVRATGVDSLAVAIGTSHGLFPPEFTPQIKIDLLREIKAAVQIPLVLHGGSGNPDAEIGQAAKLGINKINISSDIKVAYHQEMREVLKDAKVREPNVIQPRCIEAMKKVAAHKIRLFGADGKAAGVPAISGVQARV
ncbi:ketose-bisphosphate aldolase [Ruania halotolerans]|uniref:ketose-bisphosphate aldolase n=1 Tax=Ruania halotolerans TaxID=2897773 RepID=UPI001E5D6FCD|nr:ketose-bisphosphate aldolase [Ruania halotolerans]UFU08014.1 ketose-bisphosphate aldolase [Ruania halotolerans]